MAIRGLLARLLRLEHYEAETAADGEEAIRKMDAGDYSVVILDLMMPRVNGHEVISHVKDEHPEMLHRIIVLSVAPTAEVRREPVFAVVSKPFELSTFRRLIDHCARGNRESVLAN
jgi:DNA-binding NtrC family response regulator